MPRSTTLATCSPSFKSAAMAATAGAANGGLRLDRRAVAMRVIKPGDSSGSKLHVMVSGAGKLRMPPRATAACQRDRYYRGGSMRARMAGGRCAGRVPWSFAKLRRPASADCAERALEPKRHRCIHSSQAERERDSPIAGSGPSTLLRRLYLDLIGLPPTPEQTEAFLADNAKSIRAAGRSVARLAALWREMVASLAGSCPLRRQRRRRPRFPRPFAWRYRDWVINAFNRDMPFDRFTIEQMAGRPAAQRRLSPRRSPPAFNAIRSPAAKAASNSSESGSSSWWTGPARWAPSGWDLLSAARNATTINTIRSRRKISTA